MEKREIARNKQFLLFPQCFLPFWRTFCHIHRIWNCCLHTLSVWKSLKIVIWERVNIIIVYQLKIHAPGSSSNLNLSSQKLMYPIVPLFCIVMLSSRMCYRFLTTFAKIWAFCGCHTLRYWDLKDRIFFLSCYLRYFRCTQENHSHYFRFNWERLTSRILNNGTGFPCYNGNNRDDKIWKINLQGDNTLRREYNSVQSDSGSILSDFSINAVR